LPLDVHRLGVDGAEDGAVLVGALHVAAVVRHRDAELADAEDQLRVR